MLKFIAIEACKDDKDTVVDAEAREDARALARLLYDLSTSQSLFIFTLAHYTYMSNSSRKRTNQVTISLQ